MTKPSERRFRIQQSRLWILVVLGLLGLYGIGGQWGIIGTGQSDNPSLNFISLYAVTWVGCLIFLLVIPRHWSFRKSALFILSVALICRILLLPLPPSDDINRYLWEGRMLTVGISPYHFAPNDPQLHKYSKEDPYHPHINHSENPAAYPPFALYLFALISMLSYTPMALKILMIIMDMGALVFLFTLLKHRFLDARWAVLYALNPLILYSFAGHGHFDAIQVFFLLGAFCFFDNRKWIWMFIFAGLAVQSKYVAIVVIPFLMNRDNWKYSWVCLLSIAIPYLPLLNADWKELFLCIIKFGEEYAFNGSIHAVFRFLLGGIEPAVMISKFLIVGLLFFGYWRFHPLKKEMNGDPINGSFFAFGVLLLFAPTVHFWYLTWIFPFVVLRPSMSWIILSLTISAYFVVFGNMVQFGKWHLPARAQLTVWLPFYLLLLRDIVLFFHRSKSKDIYDPPKSVSVVIPVKNEEALIHDCITAIKGDPAVCEIIVVDGASNDDTITRASKSGAHVIEHPDPPEKGGGRGGQILAGVQAATGDAIAIVHADVLMAPYSFTKIVNLLKQNPTIVGGALGSTFDDNNWRYRFLDFANDAKAVYFGISFGDQVQFFRRKPIITHAIFPNIPLMEDVELSIRLHRCGRQAYLFGSSLVSTRRWMNKKSRNLLTVIKQFFSYILIRPWKTPDAVKLYKNYYQSDIS